MHKESAKLKNYVHSLFSYPVSEKTLDLGIRYLRHDVNCKKKGKIKHCLYVDPHCKRLQQPSIHIKARYAGGVTDAMKRALLLHDWDCAAELLLNIFKISPRYFTSYYLRAGMVILLNHPRSSPQLVCDFIRMSSNYILDDDIDRMVVLLCGLQQKILKCIVGFKHKRRSTILKIIDDPEFTFNSMNQLDSEG